MVEGHSVHRVASLHRKRLVGRTFHATSPNGRFVEGAQAIHGKTFQRIEAVGKNLFAFFGTNNNSNKTQSSSDTVVVVHVHFGMAGNWAVYDLTKTGGDNETPPPPPPPPEPSKTNRLRLQDTKGQVLAADLSAMTVQHGGIDLYHNKRAKLGEYPLRDDADPDGLWKRVQVSSKSIGALIMDQSFFTGPGNIYRAEILFKAGVHPDRPGKTLSKREFDVIWYHTVDLLQRGYTTGSILTVDPVEARALGQPNMRRYIYNTQKCPRCSSRIQTWQIANRTCYACLTCQPLHGSTSGEDVVPTAASSSTSSSSPVRVVTPQKAKVTTKSTNTKTQDCQPFDSHCARETVATRLAESGPSRLTVKELQTELAVRGITTIPSNTKKKAQLVALLELELGKKTATTMMAATATFVSSEMVAAEKAAAGESLAVEHVAELAPGQARHARARGSSSPKTSNDRSSSSSTATASKRTTSTAAAAAKRSRSSKTTGGKSKRSKQKM